MIARHSYRWRSRTILLALTLTLALGSTSAWAQAGGGSRESARQAFEKGRALYGQRLYLQAISSFEKAYELRPHYMVLCSIARCYEDMNQFVKAGTHYRRCLRDGARKQPMAAEVRRSLRGVEKQITWLAVESPGRGGTVYLDGQPSGSAPARIPVNPGTHTVEVRRPDAAPARASIKTLGGEERTLTLVPLDLTDERAGASTRSLGPTVQRREGLSPWWFWGGAALSAGLAAAAIVFSVQTVAKKSDYEANPTEAGYDAFTSRRLLSNIFWGATAAAGASTTVLYFFTDFGGATAERSSVARARTVGLALRGRF